jgi:arylsulfatase A-like enzyme
MPDQTKRPHNVLFILTDQERHFDEYPPGVQRPALQRLQAMGTTFTNHYNCSTVCTPSRSNILTGQHIVHTGMFDNANFPWQDDMSTEIPTMGDRMREAGYYTAYKGKWHLSQDFEQPLEYDAKLLSMEDYGFSDYLGIGDIIGMTRGGYRSDAVTASMAMGWLRSQGERCREEGQPWLLFVGLVNPHDVMFFDTDTGDESTQDQGHGMDIARAPRHERYQATYDDAPLPDNLFQPLDEPGRPAAHENYLKVHDMMVGHIPRERDRFKRYQDYYFNCLRDMDVQLGRLLDELEDLGQLENTVIIYTADHGELGGAHGLHGKGAAPYREQNNVPLIIAHPDRPRGERCQALTSHIDLLPTVIGMSDLDADREAEVTDGLPGHNLAPLLMDPVAAGVQALRSEVLWAYNMFLYLDPAFIAAAVEARRAGRKPTVRPDLVGIRGAIRSIVDGRYRYSRYFAPRQHNRPETLEQILQHNDIELFDLENDPGENHNLAVEPERHRELIEELNARMNAIIEAEIGQDVGQMLPDADQVSWHVDRFDP